MELTEEKKEARDLAYKYEPVNLQNFDDNFSCLLHRKAFEGTIKQGWLDTVCINAIIPLSNYIIVKMKYQLDEEKAEPGCCSKFKIFSSDKTVGREEDLVFHYQEERPADSEMPKGLAEHFEYEYGIHDKESWDFVTFTANSHQTYGDWDQDISEAQIKLYMLIRKVDAGIVELVNDKFHTFDEDGSGKLTSDQAYGLFLDLFRNEPDGGRYGIKEYITHTYGDIDVS